LSPVCRLQKKAEKLYCRNLIKLCMYVSMKD